VERADVEFETRSLPNLLVATLATLPSMSLIPSAPLKLVRCPHFDSCAPAHIDLSVCPSMSLAPRGSILAPTLVAYPFSSIRRGSAAAMRADLVAIGWLPRMCRDRQDLSPAVCRLRAIPRTGAVLFSVPTATHQQPLRFQLGCSQRPQISTSW